MKKTILKFLFIIACIGGIIFLLLPFLETTPPATTQLKSTQPQIVTENPLNSIAERLSSLFGRRTKEHNIRLLAATPQDRPAYMPPAFGSEGQPHTRASQQLQSSQNPEKPLVTEGEEIPVSPILGQEYGEASFQTDDGEWVLVRQIMPKNAQPGMHEVNVHEDPYTRYIKQERARRFQPPAQRQIPDSKWARLLRPIRSFLGLQGPQPVVNRPVAIHPQTGRSHATQGWAGNGETSWVARRTRLPWPEITPTQWARMTEEERQYERERRGVAEFVDILSGTHAAEDAAAIVAEAQYPDPKDEGKREALRQRLSEENKQKIKAGLLEAMRANAQGKETVDELGHIMIGCSNASLPKRNCITDQPEETGSLFSSDEVAAMREQSRQLFFEKTHYTMPHDLPLLPVLGPTTPQTIEQMVGFDDVEKTIDIYKFLYKANNCESQDCFLIPNSIQANEQLRDTFKLANTKLVTDPDNFYMNHKEGFIRYYVEQAQQQQAENPAAQLSEEELRKQAEKQFTENAVNWLFVTPEQLKHIYDVHTLQAADPHNTDTNIPLAVLYQTNPLYAEKMYHALGDSPIFGYALEPLTSVEVTGTGMDANQIDKQTVLNAAQLLVPSLAENVNTAFNEMNKVTQQAVSEGTRAGINQGNILQAIQNRNTRTNSGKK